MPSGFFCFPVEVLPPASSELISTIESPHNRLNGDYSIGLHFQSGEILLLKVAIHFDPPTKFVPHLLSVKFVGKLSQKDLDLRHL